MSLQLLTGTDSFDYDGPWQDLNEPQVIFAQAKRKTGKGVAIASMIQEAYKAGFTIFHGWAARNNENWYYAKTKHCKDFWKDWKLKHKDELEAEKLVEPLHCNCNKTIPISVMIDHDIARLLNQKEFDRFNGKTYKNYLEHLKLFEEGKINDFIPNQPWIDYSLMLKPENLWPKKEMIRIKPFHIPKGNNEAVFWQEFTDMVLECRKEGRILVNNPMMYSEGLDKFITMEYIIRHARQMIMKHFIPLDPEDVGVETRDDMLDKQKSWHKFLMVLGEIKTLSPSSKLTPEKGAGNTKKALYDGIGEIRHWPAWLYSDYQSPEDLFGGVKHQADLFIIKRATPGILGDDWSFLFDNKKSPILKEREKIFNQYGGINVRSLYIANKEWPVVQRIPDNKGYVVFDDENVRLVEFDMPYWHHKHTKDHFMKDFKITLPDVILAAEEKENAKMSKKELKSKESTKTKRQIQHIILKDVDYLVIKEGLKYPEIKKKLIGDYEDDQEKLDVLEPWDPESMGATYRRWKKKNPNQK